MFEFLFVQIDFSFANMVLNVYVKNHYFLLHNLNISIKNVFFILITPSRIILLHVYYICAEKRL